MKTVMILDDNQIKKIEFSVMREFNCNHKDIVCVTDTFFKKITVFILFKLCDYNQRYISRNYTINYMYVPTVAAEIESQYIQEESLRVKIIKICKEIGYEFKN